jgi:NADPH:quinone reductase-like Zn-dependent oxidoreductase
MKTVVYESFGGPEVLQLQEIALPIPGRGQVRVTVRAASINPIDGKFRRGELKLMSGTKFPKRVGGDLAGVVDAVGPEVEGLRVGDEVVGMVDGMLGGAYGEAAVTRPELLVAKPSRLSFEEAASVPVVALAAYLGLTKGRVVEGTRVLIHGVSGGVGTFAVQIAKLLGAHVTATATGEGLKLVETLGAYRVLDYRKVDVAREPDRYDVIFELSGRLPFDRAASLLLPQGRFVDPTPTPTSIVLSALANPFRSRKHVILMSSPSAEALRWIFTRLEDGRLRPVVAKAFPLAQVREAVQFAEQSGVAGKVVLRVD